MSYTLDIEPSIVKEAESCAVRNGTTLDAMVRACLLVFVSQNSSRGAAASSRWRNQSRKSARLEIGSMKDELRLPDGFDEAFDALDRDAELMFNGAAL